MKETIQRILHFVEARSHFIIYGRGGRQKTNKPKTS